MNLFNSMADSLQVKIFTNETEANQWLKQNGDTPIVAIQFSHANILVIYTD
ncbi:hypothetical protein P9749_15940 [Geobacillus stearothermophilus]|uniref:hypothetical protein n=1 Tax=Geobacillus stearothermophilus TaxID=1422 RepID=UPI002E1FBB6E|nr:hypothetical protein [Geobacillus stearothermophilus]